MKHIKAISLFQSSGSGETTPLEAIILVVFSVLFSGYNNYSSVLQNLQKFYAKT